MEEARAIRREKQEAVSRLADKFATAKSVFLTDYSGLTVEAMTTLRRNFRKSNVEYLVTKNTLTRRAAEQSGYQDLLPHLQGPTALAFGMGDPAAPAKVMTEFLKKNDKPTIKALIFEGKYFEASVADEIAKLPAKEELIARLAQSLNSPVVGLASALQGIIRKLAYALNAVANQKEQAGEVQQ